MMSARLELRQRQKQVFNARFSIAVHILQLPLTELVEHIQDAVDSNPLLEEVAPQSVGLNADLMHGSLPDCYNSFDYLEYVANMHQAPSLREHLLAQVFGSGMTGVERTVAQTIIQSLDERGYLRESVDTILSMVDNANLAEGDIMVTLAKVQRFEPLGVAARNLEECLCIQIDAQPKFTSICQLARDIVANNLQQVAESEYTKLSELYDCDLKSVHAAVELIKSLDPSPGNQFGESAQIVEPDVIVRKIDNNWQVELNSSILPQLKISNHYQSMFDNTEDDAGREYLEKNLTKASSFLDGLSRRHQTVLRVARAIVSCQQSFLDEGENALRPLKLRDIADMLELHQSTVSRACMRKYMLTPRGTIEFKRFFSVGIASKTGSDVSVPTIKSKIKQILEQEDPRYPLSDQQITDTLHQSGLGLSRRAVAKYRTEMKLPSRKLRRAVV